VTQWRENLLARGYVPGQRPLVDMVWDLPDWPTPDPGEPVEDYLARLRHHRRECEAWEAKHQTRPEDK